VTLLMFRPVRSKRRRIYHSNIVAVEVSLRSQIPTTTVETTATIRAAGRDPCGDYLKLI